MTTFANQAELTSSNVLFDLVKFVVGATTYGYTSGAISRVHLGVTYRADQAMIVGETKEDRQTGHTSLELTIPIEHEIAQKFKVTAPSEDVKVTLMLGHEGDVDPDMLIVWTGYVSSVSTDWDKGGDEKQAAKLICQSRLSKLYRLGLPYRYGSACQHTVYRGGCQLSLEANKMDVFVDAIAGSVITAAAIAGQPATRFPAGMVRFGTQWRDIVSQSGSTVTLNYPFEALSIGDSVSLFSGCNRSESRCIELGNFENILRFDIPTKNIFVTGLT